VLPKRFLGNPNFGDRHHLTMLAALQPSFEDALLSRAAQLLEPPSLDLARRPGVEDLERAAAPQLQRPTKGNGRSIRLAGGGEQTATLDQVLEATGVQRPIGDGQPIAGGCRLNQLVPDGATQPPDTSLNDLRPRRGRRIAPHCLGQPIGRNDVARLQRQRREHDLIPPLQPYRASVNA
jgi:hypothetical protein